MIFKSAFHSFIPYQSILQIRIVSLHFKPLISAISPILLHFLLFPPPLLPLAHKSPPSFQQSSTHPSPPPPPTSKTPIPNSPLHFHFHRARRGCKEKGNIRDLSHYSVVESLTCLGRSKMCFVAVVGGFCFSSLSRKILGSRLILAASGVETLIA